MTSLTTVRSLGGVKSLDDSGRVGGYLIVWGSQNQPDLQKEYFTPQSDLCLEWYPKRPLLYHHGLDGKLKTSVIGEIDTLDPDDVGVWMEAQLDLRNKYVRAVRRLLEKGALGASSGSLDHLVEIVKGWIKRWPLVEGSLTPAPAEPRLQMALLPAKHFVEAKVFKACIKSLNSTSSLEALLAKAGVTLDGDADEDLPDMRDWGEPVDLPDVETEIKNEEQQPMTLPIPTPPAPAPPATPPALKMDPPAMPPQQPPPQEEDKKTFSAEDLTAIVNAVAQRLSPNATPEQIQGIVAELMSAMQQAAAPAAVNTAMVKSLLEDAAWFNTHIVARVEAIKTGQKFQALVDAHLQNRAGMGGQSQAGVTTRQQPANITVSSPYRELDAADMAFYLHTRNGLRGAQGLGLWVPEQTFYRELAEKFEKEQAQYLPYLPGAEVDARNAPAVKAIMAIKSDELMYTTQVGYGAEWIPDLWATQIFELVRRENPVAGLFQVVDMPSNPYNLPLEGGDPVVERATETKDDTQTGPPGVVTASKFGTANTQLIAKKVGLRMPFSYEMDDLAVIQFIPEARRKATVAFAEAVDYMLLNADPATGTGNINEYDVNVSASSKANWLLGWKGILRHIFDVAEATRPWVNGGNAYPTLSLMRQVQRKLWRRAVDKTADLIWLVDELTQQAMKEIPQIQTIDKYGPNAVILKGEVAKLDNISIVSTEQLRQGDLTGMQHGTDANNTQGRGVLVYRPHYKVGYRRNVTTWFKYYDESDSYQLGAWLEIAFLKLYDLATAGLMFNMAV